MTDKASKTPADVRGLKHGYRSGLEDEVAKSLKEQGINPQYEEIVIRYEKPVQKHRYSLDFLLPNGIAIETKGRFTSSDRKKHLLIKEQFPDLDLRFVFSNPAQKLSKKSKTSYGDWCEKHGFPYAKGEIPQEWVEEETNWRSLRLAEMFQKQK